MLTCSSLVSPLNLFYERLGQGAGWFRGVVVVYRARDGGYTNYFGAWVRSLGTGATTSAVEMVV